MLEQGVPQIVPFEEVLSGVDPLPELLYVLGAMLGDGCIYFWRNQYQNWLVGNRDFATRFAEKATVCLKTRVVPYYYRRRNYWFVIIKNSSLFSLVDHVRRDKRQLKKLIFHGDGKANALALIQGFFDAEGCVKIINDKARHVAKVCLDITNTDLALQEAAQSVLKEMAGIESTITSQKDPRPNRRVVYHLRIYRKSEVRKFIELMPTVKMTEAKSRLLSKWLEKENWRVQKRLVLNDPAEP